MSALKPNSKAPAMTSDLIARIEAAQPGETRGLLELAWNAVHDHQKAPWQKLAVGDGMERFRRFLEAEAYFDAAMMLVPEGWRYGIMGRAGYVECGIGPEEECAVFTGRSETPALALAAASLKAKDASDDG